MVLCPRQHAPDPDLTGHQSETVLGIAERKPSRKQKQRGQGKRGSGPSDAIHAGTLR
jgi:hypothetical protein